MKNNSLILLLLFIFGSFSLIAQKEEITLSGTIISKEEHKKAIPFVSVYNTTSKSGTVSNTEGEFSIKMGANDTILFSTVQHIEQKYYIKDGEFFHDKNITIDLHQDTVWLKAVSVMGFQEYGEFKEEVVAMDMQTKSLSYAMPTIDKYAKQNATGEGAIELTEPLTYLFQKMHLLKSRTEKKLTQE